MHSDPVLIGHPFAPIGCGESLRCSYRALRSVASKPALLDVYRIHEREQDFQNEFGTHLVKTPGNINIYHLNADEVDGALAAMGGEPLRKGYNIIYPNWELSRFPSEWIEVVNRFDEMWAPSQFIADALQGQCEKPLLHMPVACEVALSSLLSRRYFGIPESSYAFVFFFDFRSYATRKNPHAVIAAFRQLLKQRPNSDCCLVIKVNGSENAPEALSLLEKEIRSFRNRILLINRTVTDNEVKNLIRCCDSFISLHRSEGFGRGLAEAMYLEKPLIATGYSGNMDFMDRHSALLVDYALVPVLEGQYPHHEGQVWAEADVAHAAAHMVKLVDDPQWGRELGKRASRTVRDRVGYRTIGMRYQNRLAQIEASQ